MLNPVLRLARPYRLLADAYDDVIGHSFFERLRRVFEQLIDRYRIPFSSAADLGCGTGLFARHLSNLWRVPVFGVDASPDMLRIASDNCRRARVTLLRQDIRALRLPAPVDLVTANFDTVNHLLEEAGVRSLFARVHRHLRPGGHFIFDFLTPCDPLADITIQRSRSPHDPGKVTQRIQFDPARHLFTYHVFLRDSVELHRERAYRAEDVARWLSESGFILRDVLDAATLHRPRRCPRRIIAIAQKA